MSKAIQRRWTGHTSHQVGAVLRFCAALVLILQIVYTPIHLCLEPHSDEANSSAATPLASVAAFVGDEDQDGDGHRERHPGAQHKLKVLRSERGALVELIFVPAVQWVDAEQDNPQPRVFSFSGLSPPELPRRWQFLFRAALPVRAPSLLS